jgi:hypothetical protein
MPLKPLTYQIEVIFALLLAHWFWLLQWYGTTSMIFKTNKSSHRLRQHLWMATDAPNMRLFPAWGITVKPLRFPWLLLHLISLLWTGAYSFLQPFKHSQMACWWLCTLRPSEGELLAELQSFVMYVQTLVPLVSWWLMYQIRFVPGSDGLPSQE